jgi:pyrimidine operon attenuation protein/uracil phosphoribosyltransferase
MTTPTSQAEVKQLLQTMAEEIKLSLGDKSPLIIGIHTGGVWIVDELMALLGEDFFEAAPGILNIAYYRDDFTRIGMHPQVQPSDIPFEVDDRHLILVDDVLHSGRTVRAALNEIFDYGRPASVTLVALIERNGRELPIQADIIGHSVDLAEDQHIKLINNNDGLELVVKTNEVQ